MISQRYFGYVKKYQNLLWGHPFMMKSETLTTPQKLTYVDISRKALRYHRYLSDLLVVSTDLEGHLILNLYEIGSSSHTFTQPNESKVHVGAQLVNSWCHYLTNFRI